MLYFSEPLGQVKVQKKSKNIPRYITLICLIRDLLSSNMFPFKVMNFWSHVHRGTKTRTNFVAIFVLVFVLIFTYKGGGVA